MKIYNIIHEVAKNYRVVIDQHPVLVSNYEFVVEGQGMIDYVLKGLENGWNKKDFEEVKGLGVTAYKLMAEIPKSKANHLEDPFYSTRMKRSLDPVEKIMFHTVWQREYDKAKKVTIEFMEKNSTAFESDDDDWA